MADPLEALRDFAFGDGEPFTITVPVPLSAHGQRLADSLGVRVEVRPVELIDIQDATSTRDCPEPGCLYEAEPGRTHCRHHRRLGDTLVIATRRLEDRPAVPDLPARPSPAGSGEAAAAVADDGGATKQRRPPIRWTRETAIVAIHHAAAELGHPPAHKDYKRRPDLPMPSEPTAARMFGSWAGLIEAAGFERPTRSTRYKRAPSERPSAVVDSDVTGSAADLPGEEKASPEPPSRADSIPVRPGRSDDALDTAERTLAERAPERLGPDEARSAGVREAPPYVDLTELRERAVRVVDDLFDALQRAFPTPHQEDPRD